MPKLKKLTMVIWSDIKSRQNLDAYITILIGMILGILGLFGVPRFEFLASAILILISSVMWTTLTNRHTLAELSTCIEKIQSPNQILEFAKFPNSEIRVCIRNAKEISLSGLNFLRFFHLFFDDVEYALRNGGFLKVIVGDPDSGIPEMASFRSGTNTNAEIERQR
jgi:hypothetical protein